MIAGVAPQYVETDYGVVVTWDRVHSVRVLVQPFLARQVCGLCGDYNGDPSDDMRLGPNTDTCVHTLPKNGVVGTEVRSA